MSESETPKGDETETCPDCGKTVGSFACKVRHVQINSGAAKAARDVDKPNFGLKDIDNNKF